MSLLAVITLTTISRPKQLGITKQQLMLIHLFHEYSKKSTSLETGNT